MCSGRGGSREVSRTSSENRSFHLQELHAHRRGDFELLAGGGELAGLLVDAKHDDVVRFLIGGKQILAGGIEFEAARNLAARWDVIDLGQRALPTIDGENRDAVVSAVGGV